MKVGHSIEEFFLGATTVGEKGQVVIPAAARKAYGVEPGDRLLVFGDEHRHILHLAKVESIRELLEWFSKVALAVEKLTEETSEEKNAES